VHDHSIRFAATAITWDGDVDRAGDARAKPPQRRRAVVTENRAVAAREQRGGLGGEGQLVRVRNPIDAVVDTLEAAVAEATGYRSRIYS
jgi:hypothetical protein